MKVHDFTKGVQVEEARMPYIAKAPTLSGRFEQGSGYNGYSNLSAVDLTNKVNLQNSGVNVKDIHPLLADYVTTLPENIRKKIVISSGRDSAGVHVTGSRHNRGEALDISLKDVDGNQSEEIANYLSNDPKAKQLGLYIRVEKNRGSNPNGRHVHMQTTDEAIQKYNQMIPKLAYGGYVNPRKMADGGLPFQQIGQLGSSVIDLANPKDKVGGNVASGILKGAGTGAGIGSMIMPGIGTAIGAGVGGLAGGIISGFQAKKRNDDLNKQNASINQAYIQNEQLRSNAIMNTQQSYLTNGNNSFYAQGGVPPQESTRVQLRPYMIGGNNTRSKDYKMIRDTIQEAKDGEKIANGMAFTSNVLGYIPNPIAQAVSYAIGFPGSYKSLKYPKDNIDKVSGAVGLVPTPKIINSGINTLQFINDARLDNKNLKYAQGGMPPQVYEAEKGEVIQGQGVEMEDGQQLASDVHQVGGETHGNGGTMAQGGEKVYSNRIVIGEDMSTLLKQAGYKFDTKATYAEVATQLGKNKGKYEEPSQSKDKITGQTAKLMLHKLDTLLELLFMGQEQYKGQGQQFAYGGYVRKMVGGGLIPYQEGLTNALQSINDYKKQVGNIEDNGWGRINTPNLIKPKLTYQSYKPNFLNQTTESNISNALNEYGKQVVPSEDNGWGRYSAPNTLTSKPFSVNKDRFNLNDRVPALNNKITSIPSYHVKEPNDYSEIASYLQAGAGALQDRAYINRLNTKVPISLQSNPNYNYIDRSGADIRDVDTTTRNLMTNLDRSGASASSKAAVYGKALEAKSNIRGAENQRFDAYNQQYNNQVYANNIGNNAMIMGAQREQIENQNQKSEMIRGSNNANLNNLAKIQQEKNLKDLDLLRMAFIDRTANIGRSISDYQSEQAKARIQAGKGSNMDYFNQRISKLYQPYGG